MVRRAQLEEDLEDFLLSLPFGRGKNAVFLEEAIGNRLRHSEQESLRYQQKAEAWCASVDSGQEATC
jgi:hypothetical protein